MSLEKPVQSEPKRKLLLSSLSFFTGSKRKRLTT